MLLVKDFNLRDERLLTRPALDLFYKFNHLALCCSNGLSVEITISDLVRAMDSSRTTVIRAKTELIDKGYISQTKSLNNRCTYTLTKMSYDLFVGALLSSPTSQFLLDILDSSVEEHEELLHFLQPVDAVSEESLVEEKVLALVGSAEEPRIPRPITRVGKSTSQTFTDNTSSKMDRIHPFVEWKKPLEKWNSADFSDYFMIQYNQNVKTKCPFNKIANPTMARELKRLSPEGLKQQIKAFFEFCAKAGYVPSWETFANANVQQKLDHYVAKGEISGYGGKIKEAKPVVTQTDIEAEEALTEIKKQVTDINIAMMKYERCGESIFDDPLTGEKSRASRELAIEKGFALFNKLKHQTKDLTIWLKAMGVYREGMENEQTL
jgi:hypothetical protein